MKSQDPVNPADPKSIWPDDWFIYDNGKVSGPFSANEAFLNAELDSSSRLVSRKGFTQWYPLRDFVHLYKYAYAARETELPKIDQPESTPAKVTARTVGPAQTQQPKDPNLSLAHYVAHDKPAPLEEEKAKPNPETVEAEKQVVSEKVSLTIEPTSVEQEYLMSKGRIRLGVIRNSFAISFIYGLLSLGLYYPFWYRRVFLEVNYHLDGSQKKSSFLTALMLWIPILHFIPVYKLSKKVLEMESQNNLQSTSVVFALLMSVIPFAGISYLQFKINSHWMAHARHAFAQRIASKNS